MIIFENGLQTFSFYVPELDIISNLKYRDIDKGIIF